MTSDMTDIENKGTEKKGFIIENGKVIEYPYIPNDLFPLSPPSDFIKIWVGKNDFYYTPFGYKPDEHGHILIPVTSQLSKDAGVKEGLTLIEAKKRIEDYVGDRFLDSHQSHLGGI